MRSVVIIALLCRAALAGDRLPTAPVDEAKLPHGVTMRGEDFISASSFGDNNGTNYVVFSATVSAKQQTYGIEKTTLLYVDDWVVPKRGAPRNLLPVRDMVAKCVMGDPSATFHDNAFTVTDLDHDGVAEITFGYQLANCRSDVRPAVYKVLLLENGTKYILRGETVIKGGDPPGGTFTADPEEASWPPAFLAHAKDVWAATDRDVTDR